MSEPISRGPRARNKPSPSSSSTASPEQKSIRPRAYSKYDAKAGDLFAHARNLDHSLAQSALAFAATSSSASSAQLPATFAFVEADTLARSFVPETEVRRDVPVPAAVKQGLEKGSYRGLSTNPAFPFGGQEALPPASSAFALRPDYRNHTQRPKVPPGPTPTARTIVPLEDAKERVIFLGPLRIAHHHCRLATPNHNNCGAHPASMHANFLHFLNTRMAGTFQKVIQKDPFIPGAVYTVAIKMTDTDLLRYHLLLQQVPEALEMQRRLEADPEGFDEFTASQERTELQVETYRFLAHCRLEGQELDEVSRGLIGLFGPTWKASGAYVG